MFPLVFLFQSFTYISGPGADNRGRFFGSLNVPGGMPVMCSFYAVESRRDPENPIDELLRSVNEKPVFL